MMGRLNKPNRTVINRIGGFYVPEANCPSDQALRSSRHLRPRVDRFTVTDTKDPLALDSTTLPDKLSRPLTLLIVSFTVCGLGFGLAASGLNQVLTTSPMLGINNTIIYGVAAATIGAIAGFGSLVTLVVRLAGVSRNAVDRQLDAAG